MGKKTKPAVKTSPEVLKFLREIGAKGGEAKAARHSKQQLREWGKLGGRPRKKTSQK